MAMIADLFGAVAAAVAAFFGHVVAHDFVELTPRLSRLLIGRATSILPKRDRARYREEWLSDLNDRVGVFAKLSHAFGCVWCARNMRRESIRTKNRSDVIRIQFGKTGTIECDPATYKFALRALQFVHFAQKHTWTRKSIFASAYLQMHLIRIGRRYGPPDPAKALRILDLVRHDDDVTHWSAWINDRPISLTDVGFKDPRPL